MDRALIGELHALLAPEGEGGLVESAHGLDEAALAATANEYGARFVVLRGPRTREQVISMLLSGLGSPGWAGHNWDAVEERLGQPEPDAAGPIVIAWHDPLSLAQEVDSTFRSVIRSAAEARARSGDGSLLVVAGPSGRSRSSEDHFMPNVPEGIRRLGKVHHVALIVRSIDDALGLWRDALGLDLETVMDMEHDRVRIAFLGVGESKVELVEPTDTTTGVARFLETKGEGFHHVCFEVPNLAETLLRLEIDGLELIDSAPRRGAEGPVAFIHPRSCHGVLVELIEAPGGPAWKALGFV